MYKKIKQEISPRLPVYTDVFPQKIFIQILGFLM